MFEFLKSKIRLATIITYLNNEIMKLKKVISAQKKLISAKVKEMDQQKVYLFIMEESEEVDVLRLAIEEMKSSVPWTIPKIIVVNKLNANVKEIEEKFSIKDEEVKEVDKKYSDLLCQE